MLTPFILLQKFLVDLVSTVSRASFSLGSLQVPIVPLIALVILVLAIARFRTRITRWIIAAALVVVLLDAVAQEVTDYYMAHKFYDLQQNWHYIAYGLFAFMMYRDLTPRGYSLARILWLTCVFTLGYSCFDEFFQMHMSSRVFDLSDTAKDFLGAIMGMTLLSLGGHPEEMVSAWREIRTRGEKLGVRDLLGNPVFALAAMIVFDVIFLSCASLLSDFSYAAQVVWLSLLLFVPFFVAMFLLPRRWGRIVVLAVAALILVPLAFSRIAHGNEQVTHHRYGLTVYRGVPVPFFDVIIFPNGHFRLADKKHYFNPRDQKFLLQQKADIILIGSGERGLGGQGFAETSVVQFVFNEFLDRPSQVIIVPSAEACKMFNRLKQEGRNVLFVLHNTC